MMDEYMKKYSKQMDEVMISQEADDKILKVLLAANAQRGKSYKRSATRGLSAAAVAGIVVVASSATAFAGVAIHGAIVKSQKADEPVAGVGAHVDLGQSDYYDLMAGSDGSIYALTDNDNNQELSELHAIVWKSTDQATSWESVLSRPDDLSGDTDVFAGDLYEGADGVEALILVDDGEGTYVYQVGADDATEFDMTDVLTETDGSLFQVKYVNDNTIALITTSECLLYDTKTQEIKKQLPYNLTMGCLLADDKFLIYGSEVYSCVDAQTLEEQEPEEGLCEFIETMYQYNDAEVLPQMAALDDTIVCVAKRGIYEYQNGATTEMKLLADTAMDDGHASNGLMPMCKNRDGEYYVCKYDDEGGMTIWQVDQNAEEMK